MALVGVFLSIGLIVAVAFVISPGPKLDSEINFLWWSNTTHPPILVENFEKEFGVKVNVYDMGSEGNMTDILESGSDKYDIVGVTNIYINQLIKDGLIVPIDEKNVPNLKNLDKKCSGLVHNTKKIYMAPIIWGTNGVVFNRKYLPEDTDSWDIFWNPEYAGKIALQDNRNDAFQVALKYIGYHVYPENMFQLLEAKKFLLQQKPLLKGYENQYLIMDQLISEELWAAHIAIEPAMMAIAANPNLEYVIPKEGSVAVYLGIAITATSKKKYTDEVFINYLMRPENNAATANYIFVAPCSSEAKNYLNKEFLSNRIIYPTEDELERLESPADYNVTDDIISEMEDIWEELTGSNSL